jgi:hypothetical protein
VRVRLVNNTGSPYDVNTLSGPAIVPANGEMTDEFADGDVEMFRAAGVFTVMEPEAEKTKPVEKPEKSEKPDKPEKSEKKEKGR